MSKLIKKITEKFDNDKILTFEDLENFDPDESWTSTGSPSLDYHFKTFGWPNGIVEVRGESQSGKTTLSLQNILQTQREYGEQGVIVILSSERRDNKPYALQMGIDLEGVSIVKVQNIEDVFNKIHNFIRVANEAYQEGLMEDILAENPKLSKKGEKAQELLAQMLEQQGGLKFLFIWDSLGQTVSKQELAKAIENAEKEEQGMAALGSAARALSAGLRAFLARLDDEDITLMIINRPYDQINGGVGKKSYGGKAIMLYPCIRVELARIQGVKFRDEEIGQITQVQLIKSDFTNPKQKFNIEIGYGLGVVLNSEEIELGIKEGILEKHDRGAKFKFGKKEVAWRNRGELYELYREQHPLLKHIVKKITKVYHNRVLDERASHESELRKANKNNRD